MYIHMKEKRQILRTMFPLPQPLENMYILVNIVEHNGLWVYMDYMTTTSLIIALVHTVACIVRYITQSMFIEHV